jgi:hypothetical protein
MDGFPTPNGERFDWYFLSGVTPAIEKERFFPRQHYLRSFIENQPEENGKKPQIETRLWVLLVLEVVPRLL